MVKRLFFLSCVALVVLLDYLSPFSRDAMCSYAGIAPAVGAALVSGGVGLLGSLFGRRNSQENSDAQRYASDQNLRAQREANATNIRLAQEQRDFDRRQWEDTNAWNLEQWNRENEYNSAAAQMQRFRDAGLNPYLAMSGGADAGTAESVMSSPSGGQQAAQVSPAMQDPVQYDGTWMQNLVGNLNSAVNGYFVNSLTGAQTGKTDAERSIAETQAAFEYARQLYEMQKFRDDHKLSKSTLDQLDLANDFARETWNMRLQNMDFSNQLLQAQQKEVMSKIELNNIMTALQRQQFDFNDKHLEEQFAVQIQEAWSRIGLNRAQASSARTQAAYTQKMVDNFEASWNEQIKNNKSNRQLTKAMVGEKARVIDLVKKELGSYDTDKVYNRIGTIFGAASNAVSMAAPFIIRGGLRSSPLNGGTPRTSSAANPFAGYSYNTNNWYGQ